MGGCCGKSRKRRGSVGDLGARLEEETTQLSTRRDVVIRPTSTENTAGYHFFREIAIPATERTAASTSLTAPPSSTQPSATGHQSPAVPPSPAPAAAKSPSSSEAALGKPPRPSSTEACQLPPGKPPRPSSTEACQLQPGGATTPTRAGPMSPNAAGGKTSGAPLSQEPYAPPIPPPTHRAPATVPLQIRTQSRSAKQA